MKTFQELREGRQVDIIEAVSKVKTTMPDKVASSATRFGLKAKSQGGHVSISGPKGKLNDFLRAIIGRSSYGNASEMQKESVELEENKIFFVKVGSGRDSMTVKTKANNSRDAVKKMKTQYPNKPASLDRNQKQGQPAGAFESVKEAVGDTALAFQTPQGTVTATKRNTKGMRGKQDGYSLSLKTKSGKVVDLGSHPKPTKANVLSIAKNAMS